MYEILAAAGIATTLAGIAFWTVLLAGYVALFAVTLVSVCRSPLESRSRTRWIWFVVLVPAVGIAMWFLSGRPATRQEV
ncbi:PLDc N-terminal domain-containing protein [Actinoplanes sp. NPDC023714]|uniref:PLDc N-terminal domain-containing protein n=1 Tax=Actinoplanes sp. NPDC023714 TaxID=3154322 RepID=UPI0033DCEE47